LSKKEDFPLKDPRSGEVVGRVDARDLWRRLCRCALEVGDPGVVFLDRIEEANPTPDLGKMQSTNPCGEQPLLPYESCNLGSINVARYCHGGIVDWSLLTDHIHWSVRFLDNVVEANRYPLADIARLSRHNRKIGLGLMGWADLLADMGIPYVSKEALKFADGFMNRFAREAIMASERLAEERGAFSGFVSSRYASKGLPARRNATVTTVAPTGTISIIAGASSGIEPFFSLAYERRALDGQILVFLNERLIERLRLENALNIKVLAQVFESGSVQRVKGISARTKQLFRTALEIPPAAHVHMQAVFQKYSESAVSKTINLPAKAKSAQVSRVFELAYSLGCKGLTVYRNQAGRPQVLRAGLPRNAIVAALKALLRSKD
jgi:ribonucleoside-diphosphate reductase alpha chain